MGRGIMPMARMGAAIKRALAISDLDRCCNLVALSPPFRNHRQCDVGPYRGHARPGEIPLRRLGVVTSSAFHTGPAQP